MFGIHRQQGDLKMVVASAGVAMIVSSVDYHSARFNLQCDASYRGHPTNIFYKLANQGTRI